MNAINYTKLESIQRTRALKVSDVFKAANDHRGEIAHEEFYCLGLEEEVDKAHKNGYVAQYVKSDHEYPSDCWSYCYLTTKGLALITKHMK